MYLKRALQGIAILLFAAAVIACAQLGVSTPQTFNQKAVAAHVTVEGLAKTALTLHQAGKLADVDRQNIVVTLRSVEEGIAVATLIAKTDPTGAASKLDASVAVLTVLQAYLTKKGAP
jgi:hypothetical protein